MGTFKNFYEEILKYEELKLKNYKSFNVSTPGIFFM